MKKLIFLVGVAIAMPTLTEAQTEVDLLRYSQSTFGGTSRYNSMAGAMGALGGDFSTLSTNPAGIGVYRKSEMTISPAMHFANINTQFGGKSTSETFPNLNVGNMGIVFNNKTGGDDDVPEWKSYSFGIGFNRLNNFNQTFRVEGSNAGSSLVDVFLNAANGKSVSELNSYQENLAFSTYLIDSVPQLVYLNDTTMVKNPLYTGPNQYFGDVKHAGTYQRKVVEQAGRMGETVFSFGGNYANKIYIGGTLGISYINFSESSNYSEEDKTDTIKFFKKFTMQDNFTTRGTGYNLKLGVIYRAADWLRIGGAIHTPTSYSLTDSYETSLTNTFDGAGGEYTAEAPKGSYRYRMSTPFRAIGSVGFVIGKYGVISADYEYLDYRQARLSPSSSFFSANDAARAKYMPTGNLRMGGELRLDPLVLRAGYAYYGNPFKSGVNNGVRTSFTAGIGFKNEDFFIDVAYVNTSSSERYFLYTPPASKSLEAAVNNKIASSFMATVGFKF